jgi:LPPG:FO 2-phospho-L-lactate transferase
MADKCLAAIDVPCTAAGVGALYGARATGGVLDGWLVDTTDAETVVSGVRIQACPLWMRDETATIAMVKTAIELAEAS